MTQNYIEHLRRTFDVSDEAKSLFDKIVNAPTQHRQEILENLSRLRDQAGLSYALLALYRQQVNSGFVLADPLKTEKRTEKKFFDPNTGVSFRFQWNPYRELRKNHALLLQRGVIANGVDQSKLVNRDKDGKPCYLCKTNIDQQNPAEILLEIALTGEKFYIGANFAYITNNHFTVINSEHRPQRYRKQILEVLTGFIDKTDGYFRAIFNGLAGASIQYHEHLQATTEQFPVEQIRIDGGDVKYQSDHVRISHPKYYVPLWIVEGPEKAKLVIAANKIVEAWQALNPGEHTENIISVKAGLLYRTFIILRHKSKLAAGRAGKKGDMAAFETGGNIVLSYEPSPGIDDTNEKNTFDSATLETARQMLTEISPDQQSYTRLFDELTFTDKEI